ncbi:hypothetical protein RFI_12300, partial [Reticulomyxa filosa]
YPQWLEQNQINFESKQLENYQNQCDLYLRIYQKLKNIDTINQNNSNIDISVNINEIKELLTKICTYGTVPNELMDGIMPDNLQYFANIMLQLQKEWKIKNSNQHSINTNNINISSHENSNNDSSMKFILQMINQSSISTFESHPNVQDHRDIPSLTPDEIRQMKELMTSECLIM